MSGEHTVCDLDKKLKFLKFKEALVLFNERFGQDSEIEYFINVVDYILKGELVFTSTVYVVLYEELLIMSTIYKKSEFLQIIKVFEALYDCTEREVCCGK